MFVQILQIVLLLHFQKVTNCNRIYFGLPYRNIPFFPFPEYLEKQIQLEVPKYIREFSQVEENMNKSKPKQKRLTGNKRSFGDTDIKVNEPKKAKIESQQTNFHQLAIDTAIKHSNMLPPNFYEVADALFEEFWSLQFEDKEVDFAFFANITIHNCHEYGLTAFSEKSYSFTVIRVSIILIFLFFSFLLMLYFFRRRSYPIGNICRLMISLWISPNYSQVL